MAHNINEHPFVSIIIPCKEIDDYSRECVEYCKKLDYNRFEILLLPDSEVELLDGVRIIATGPLSPGAKRNLGVQNSIGEICAFIDSDAYPRSDWLANALNYLKDSNVSAVGGPGITPERATPMETASGFVLSSFMVGSLSKRYDSKCCIESDDIHSCNFIVKKDVLNDAGGWDEKYWPGEDTLMCLAIKNLGKKMVEASDVVVYHHRRPLFRGHLKQVSRFGLHRGFFAKKFPRNSMRLTYFIPSILLLFVFSFIFAVLIQSSLVNFMMVVLGIYLILSLFATLVTVKKVKLVFSVWLGVVATHFVYGLFFLAGLMMSDLEK